MASCQAEFEAFDSLFPNILEDITSCKVLANNRSLKKWVERILEYNVPHGKKIRGITTVLTYKTFANPATKDGFKKARVIGWCVEILQASFLVADDIMDGSEIRRGRPCWHKLPDVGITAVNDAHLLENLIYPLISKYFADNPKSYAKYFNLFKDIALKTLYGQAIDTRTSLEKDFKRFTMDTYQFQVRHKTGYYTLYLPIMLGLIVAGKELDKNLIPKFEALVFEFAFIFQAIDDFLDCFGDPEKTGKIGTDIEDGKCTYLIVKALELANDEQKAILKENYGIGGIDQKNRVIQMYQELGIPEMFAAFEKGSYEKYQEQIYDFGNEGLQSILTEFSETYKKCFHIGGIWRLSGQINS